MARANRKTRAEIQFEKARERLRKERVGQKKLEAKQKRQREEAIGAVLLDLADHDVQARSVALGLLAQMPRSNAILFEGYFDDAPAGQEDAA